MIGYLRAIPQRRRYSTGMGLLACLFFWAIAGGGCQPATQVAAEDEHTPGVSDTEIRIGASLALEGHAGYLGTHVLHGAMAYIRHVNASGGVHGRQIKVIAYDDGYVAYLNGFTDVALTKLDVLDGMPELKVCTAYRLPNGEEIKTVPDTPIYQQVEPIYETWPGWPAGSTRSTRCWDDLPEAAKNYLKRLEELIGVSIKYVSVGPEREAMFEF